jgi:hydrogenase/urease accessory protein HupE
MKAACLKTTRHLLIICVTLLSAITNAHEMSMAEVELRETSPGEFLWQWSASNDKRRAPSEDLTPHWPAPCDAEGNKLHCGSDGLKGRIEIEGVGKAYSAVLVKIYWLDDQSRVLTLTGGQPGVELYGSAQDKRSGGEIASAYFRLGIEHILGGIDHLLFVLGLLFLVGFQRQLVWTITAFTAAHSITLASAALGILTLRSPPVEACIALSIVLVAAEALHQRETLARRWPVVLAFLFGLVHGLGFAGALKEIGLPQHALPTALLCFNLGVEAGQLMVVALAGLLWYALRNLPLVQRTRAPLLYGIGSVAAYWSWLRIAAIFG